MANDDFSDIAGLPDDLGLGDDLARSEQYLTIRMEKRRYGKPVTIVEGFDTSVIDVDDVASTLKRTVATGGTVRDGRIELQGDHAARLPDVLRDEGFQVA